jgi:hypothetical protein
MFWERRPGNKKSQEKIPQNIGKTLGQSQIETTSLHNEREIQLGWQKNRVYMWIGLEYAAIATSLKASLSVGYQSHRN